MSNRRFSAEELQPILRTALEALRKEERRTLATSDLNKLLLVRKKKLDGYKSNNLYIPNNAQIVEDCINEVISALFNENANSAKLLRRAYLEGVKIADLHRELGDGSKSFSTFWRTIGQAAISHMAILLEQMEREAHLEQLSSLKDKLPPASYIQLYGREYVQECITSQLSVNSKRAIVSLHGLGGTGKTAIAHAATLHLLDTSAIIDCAWVDIQAITHGYQIKQLDILTNTILRSIGRELNLTQVEQLHPQDLLQRLKHLFANTPHLIVLDNLNSQLELTPLYVCLQGISGISKFLFVGRSKPPADGLAFIQPLHPLDVTAAAKMLHQLYSSSGNETFKSVPSQFIKSILDTVGGHPQALKLVVSLSRYYPWSTLSTQFIKTTDKRITTFYDGIYDRAWILLNEPSRQMLVALTFATAGVVEAEYLQMLLAFEDGAFWSSISQLLDLCLIERRTRSGITTYGAHELTRSYAISQQSSAPDTYPGYEVVKRGLHYWEARSRDWQSKDIDLHTPLLAPLLIAAFSMEGVSQDALSLLLRLYRQIRASARWSEWMSVFELAIENGPAEWSVEYARLLSNLGDLYRLDGRLNMSARLHHRALQHAKTSGDLVLRARESFYLCTTYRQLGQYSESHLYGVESLEIMEEIERDPRFSATVKNALGLTSHYITDFTQAEKYFRESLLVLSETLPEEFAYTYNNLGNALSKQGKYGEAKKELDIAWRLALESGSITVQDTVALSLFCCCLDASLLEEATVFAALVDERAGDLGTQHRTRILMNFALSRFYLATDEFDLAESQLARVIEAVDSAENRELLLEHKALAACIAARNQKKTANNAWRSAVAIYATLPNNPWASHIVETYQRIYEEMLTCS